MNKVSPKVLALLATLTLVRGTTWPLFAIALREMPVADVPHIRAEHGHPDAAECVCVTAA